MVKVVSVQAEATKKKKTERNGGSEKTGMECEEEEVSEVMGVLDNGRGVGEGSMMSDEWQGN